MRKAFHVIRPFLLPVLTVALLLFIFSNSAQTAGNSTGKSGPIVRAFAEFLSRLFHADVSENVLTHVIRKLAHMGEFSALSFLMSLSVLQRRKRLRPARFEIWLACLFAGLTDEFIQTFFAGRSPEVADVMIDFAGALVGYYLVALIFRKRK